MEMSPRSTCITREAAFDAAIVAVANAVEPRWVSDRKRTEHDAVDQREDGGVGTDAERQREDGQSA